MSKGTMKKVGVCVTTLGGGKWHADEGAKWHWVSLLGVVMLEVVGKDGEVLLQAPAESVASVSGPAFVPGMVETRMYP